MMVPGYEIRANKSSPYMATKGLYERGMKRAKLYGCLNPSAWCITSNSEVVIEAVNNVLLGKTCIFDNTWSFF